MRGTPHTHSLVCIQKKMFDSNNDPIIDGEGHHEIIETEDVSSADPMKVKKVTDLMAYVSTAQWKTGHQKTTWTYQKKTLSLVDIMKNLMNSIHIIRTLMTL